jgi:DNA-binding MarR family transcriptional regulator
MDEPSATDLYGPDPDPPPAPVPPPAAAPAPPKPTPRQREGPTADRRLRRFVADHLPAMTNLTDVKVWLFLHTRAGPDGTVKLSHAAIAEQLGIAKKTSGRAVKRLRTAGLLKVKKQGGFPKRVTVYRVVAGQPKKRRRTVPVVPAAAGDT